MARPRLSIVVPVYNVEAYLRECLESILTQAGPGVEIVAVDDGSTDRSAVILADMAGADPRILVVAQPNQGLGAARNRGVAAATGEYLWFVDSDDRLAPGAIDTLLSTITATGSDLVTGNVHRLIGDATRPARFLADTFARTRTRTHITRFPPLIADRVAWNKIYRRSFWDRHNFRFPVGVHYEDQYVTLPAHYLARTVDVRSEPVYLWRVREADADTSITQQRTEIPSMRDRIAAVRFVSDFLADRGLVKERRRYDESAVTHDLRYFLEVFPDAGADYQAAFLAAVTPYLATVDETAFARLPAVRRLQWRMARRGDRERLLELLAVERAGPQPGSARREGRHWYLDLPGRTSPELGLRHEDFRVRRELRLVSTIRAASVGSEELRITGHAEIELVGPARRRLVLLGVPIGRGRPLRWRTTVDEAGDYEARLPLRLLTLAANRQRQWRLILVARDYDLRRVASWHDVAGARIAAARAVSASGRSVEVRLDLTGRGRLMLTAGGRPVVVDAVRLSPAGQLDLLGSLPGNLASGTQLTVTSAAGDRASWPLHIDRNGAPAERFVARLPAASLDAGHWRLWVAQGGVDHGLTLGTAAVDGTWPGGKARIETAEDGYLRLVISAA